MFIRITAKRKKSLAPVTRIQELEAVRNPGFITNLKKKHQSTNYEGVKLTCLIPGKVIKKNQTEAEERR